MASDTPTHIITNETLVPLKSKVLHKFYEPLILAISLINTVQTTSSSPEPAALSETTLANQNSEYQAFKIFVNKLSHVRSRSKGRGTVTSFMVLRGENAGSVQYLFAANEQSKQELQDTNSYVETLLREVGQAPLPTRNSEAFESARKDIHRFVLVFNRHRITSYLQELETQIDLCIKRCLTGVSEETKKISREMQVLVADMSNKQATIRLLLQLEKSDVYSAILRRAEEGGHMLGSSQSRFSDFVHTSKRILAYPQSVQYILTVAKTKWPELFTNPAVSFLSSSTPIPTPSRVKSSSADSIVGRMTRKEKEINRFRDFVRRLQVFDLDDRIQDEYAKKFTPIVHSEVLLLDMAWRIFGGAANGEIDTSVFFNGWTYNGSSKPTFWLCNYYFQERRSGVQCRDDSHGNPYPVWAFPEVLPSQGQAAIEDRQMMIDPVLQRLRKDAFEVVRKKVAPMHKEEDSNTFTETVTLDEKWTFLSSEVDEISSLMGELHVGGDDKEDGGARL